MAHRHTQSQLVCVSICALLSAIFILPNIHLLTLPRLPFYRASPAHTVENCVSRWVLKLSAFNTQESDVFFVVDFGFKLSAASPVSAVLVWP